jgi:flagellar motor switch protein FliM
MSKMHLAIPTLLLEPILHIFDRKNPAAEKSFMTLALVAASIRTIPVNLSIGTSETLFPMQSLVSLQVGDTVVVSQRQDVPVVIKIAGKNKLQAQARMDATCKTFRNYGQHPNKEGDNNEWTDLRITRTQQTTPTSAC